MINVLYENEEILVIDKPAGLASQPGEKVGKSVISVIEQQCHFHPYPVHRLDKETAGCMLIAKDPASAGRWAPRLFDGQIKKKYRAICAGAPSATSGQYSDFLVSKGMEQSAITRYSLLCRFGDLDGEEPAFSMVEFELGTGRTHQIRKHSSMHGHPILADDKYGNFALNRRLKRERRLSMLLLWAYELSLQGVPPIHSALPSHFSEFLAQWNFTPEVQ
jgi:23S rRNA pseudouridine955/2504/2580 synthase